MSVTEVLQGSGRFSVSMSDQTPRDLIDSTLRYFGHIAIVPGRVDPAALGDGMLSAARYVGVVRTKSTGDAYSVSGAGLVLWLGDEDDKGAVLENSTVFASASFPNVIRGLLPASIEEGTLHSVPGTYHGQHQWETPRKAIGYVCDTFGAEYRVNNDGTLDAGEIEDLYVTDPACIIVRKGAGRDLDLTGLPGSFKTDQDVEDFTTRVVLLAEGEGPSIATGDADISPALNPYKDLHGHDVVRTRIVSESDTSTGNAHVRAQLQLNRFTGTRDALQLTASDFDIRGTFDVGDFVWVYDPDAGLYDTANEVIFRGQRLNPIKLRVVETSWPTTEGMTVAYRGPDGEWTDLTDYFEPETGDTTIVVGEFNKSLTSSGFEPVGSRPSIDTSIPGVPVFVTPFTSAAYLDNRGFTKSQIALTWTAPLNVDGSTVLDGDHYEIRYAIDRDVIYPAKWEQVAQVRWTDLQTWDAPFAYPDDGKWNIAYAPWGTSSYIIQDLSPGVGYDFQIRAVDKAGNAGEWGPITTAVANADNIPPSAPAPPTVASSRIAIQVIHELGKSTGGTFNLESDLDHFNVHVGTGPDFYPDDASRVGRMRANAGMIQAQIAAVETFQIESTIAIWVKVVAVDIAGNKSVPSASVQATAELIDDAHISDLTVTKVTAGTISADWIVGARIKTADVGARVELNMDGLQAYNDAGTQTVDISSETGDVSIIGEVASGVDGDRVIVNPAGSALPEIRFYPTEGDGYGRIYSQSKVGEPTEIEMFMQAGPNAEGTARSALRVLSGAIVAEVDDENGVYDTGGRLEITGNYVSIGFPTEADHPNYFRFTGSGSDDKTWHIGRWDDFVDRGADKGLFTGGITGTDNATSVSVTFAITATSHVLPIVSINDNGTAGTSGQTGVKAFNVTGSDSAGFDVRLNAPANGGWSIYFWCFRV